MKSFKTQSPPLLVIALLATAAWAQPPGNQQGPPRGQQGPPRDQQGPPNREGRPGRGMEEGPRGDFHPPMHPLFMALDANEDDEISAEEIENATAALKKLDKNNDGKLTHDELRPEGGPGMGGPGQGRFGGQDRGGQRQSRGEGGPGRGGFGRPGQGDQRKAADRGFAEHLMSFDTNNDGNITKNELPIQMQRIFQRADLNKDDVIDANEAEKLAEQYDKARAGRGGRGGEAGGGRGTGTGRPDEGRPRRPQ